MGPEAEAKEAPRKDKTRIPSRNFNFDEGKIIKRRQVPILTDDTAETLQARVLPIEYEVQIEALKDFSEGKVKEFIRKIPLVLSGEEKILEECKQLAMKMYQKG